MRAVLVAGFAAVLGVSTPAAAQEALKPFEFKQMNTSLTLAQAQAAKLLLHCFSVVVNSITVASCVPETEFAKGGIAGFEHYGLRVTFDDVGFVVLDTKIQPGGLPTVTAAFEAKYGKPCNIADEKLQNAFGAVFDQVTVTWCFSDGELKLSRYASRALDLSGIQFVAPRFADRKAPAPNVNF